MRSNDTLQTPELSPTYRPTGRDLLIRDIATRLLPENTELESGPIVEVQDQFISQRGPQTVFLTSNADIVIYGGAAGGGKTWALLVEPLRHIYNSNFSGVTFRRTSPQIRNPGGLWDESLKLYPQLRGQSRETSLEWVFPGGAKLKFAHLQYDIDVQNWQGAQVPFIGWDQLEHFTAKQFFYMLSRSRSTCGVKPYIRATCNPVPDDDPVGGWLHKLIQWWLDPETGLPIANRAGVVRWFIRLNEELLWGNSAKELEKYGAGVEPKSLTFIPAKVSDNQVLLQADPSYMANLKALPLVDRERLLGGNWNVKPSAGKIFNRDWFEVVDAVPAGGKEVRFWDLAASEKKMAGDDPDFTADCKMSSIGGVFYILDASAEQIGPAEADTRMKNKASQDGKGCAVSWEEEGGASGKRDSAHLVKLLAGYQCKGVRPQGDKVVRAKPLASQAEAGNVKLLRGAWNDRWLSHMHGQPELAHDDEMDAASGAFNALTDGKQVKPVTPFSVDQSNPWLVR